MKFSDSDYFKSLNPSAHEGYTSRAGTTANYIRVHLLAKRRIPRPALLDGLAQASQGKVSRDEVLAHFYQRETDTSPITPPPPNRRTTPDRRTAERRRDATRRTADATPERRGGGERCQGERRTAAQDQDSPKPKPVLRSDEGEADRAA